MVDSIYSPGPWHCAVINGKLAVASNYETICDRIKDHNAAELIAAAPEMLEALREAEIALKNCSEVIDSGRLPSSALSSVRDAIALANGLSPVGKSLWSKTR